jgi:sugar phosphate isomerase/epimerase
MKLSMMTYSLSRNGGMTDPREMVELTLDLKMDGIDFVTLYDRKAEELRKLCDDCGLPIVAHTFFASSLVADEPEARQEGLDACKAGIEAAVALGAPVIMIVTPGAEGVNRDALRRRWIDELAEVALLAEEAGVMLTVENFPGADSPFVTAADFLEAKAEVPSLKLTYDNGNASGGENPVESLGKTFADIVHVHFKDWHISDEPREGYRAMLDGRFFKPALIGEGDVDTAGCWNALKASGYEGYINIEYEGDGYEQGDAVRRAVEYLRAL